MVAIYLFIKLIIIGHYATMPILIKNYRWSQTDEHVRLDVPLKSAKLKANVDIFIQSAFVKVSAPPFLFEVYLAHPIDVNESNQSTRIYDNEIRLRLRKSQPQCQWETLERAIAKCETVELKEQIVEQAHQLAEAADKQLERYKYDVKQAEIQKEIFRESAIRKEVDSIQSAACGRAMNAVEDLRVEQKMNSTTTRAIHAPNVQPIRMTSEEAPAIPPVRECATIGVTFTERRFPTPMRESQAAVEQEWLVKQNEARRAVGFVEEDLRPEERNVDWLKAKAGDFFAKGNYLAAISALTTAVRMNPKCYDLYLNRASCQYAIKNYNRCVSECEFIIIILIEFQIVFL